jgi:predicted O-linked N-acetylglucosamine transferase (SPINDLY family)
LNAVTNSAAAGNVAQIEQLLRSGQIDAAAGSALLLVQRGGHQEGLLCLQKIVTLFPRAVSAWIALGNARRFLENMPQAAAAYRQALRVNPASREARYNLALVLAGLSAWEEALGLAEELVRENQQFAEGWLLLGTIQHLLGQANAAIASLTQAQAHAPSAAIHSKLLFTRQYADGASAADLLARHREWDAAHARPLLPATPRAAPARHGNSPLRLGFVAPDFLRGPTGFLAVAAIEALHRLGFSIACYADGQRSDDYTARFRAAASLWRTTGGLSDEDLAAQIRHDEIDVLFDLAGHCGARLLMFARKPAPVQITWLGYVGTTGLTAMDFLLADRFHAAEGEENWYAERVLRMPHGYVCYSPPPDAPPVGPLPAAANGYVTFGCFNSAAKYAPRIVAAWAQILSRVPGSRLLLKDFALADEGLKARLRQQFALRGIASERLLLEGPSSQIETMAAYSRVDLALDPQPYSGGLTTCEALWMGVPVITFPGQSFAGRHSTSHMTSAGYGQFVAGDLEGYMELAASWPGRLPELAAIRNAMRESVRRSPLCDATNFGKELGSRLQQLCLALAPPWTQETEGAARRAGSS